MSDESKIGPGAPAANEASKEVAPPKSLSSIPQSVDRLILRLHKLLASPGGLSSFLGTLNYTLYLLAYLESKAPSPAKLSKSFLHLLNYKRQTTKPPTTTLVSPTAGPSPIASLGGLLSKARTTLRLFSLLPLYARLRSLLSSGPKPGEDGFLYCIALAQCCAYVAYQALENIAVLADNNIFPKSMIARFNKGDATTSKVYRWAYRAWLTGVSCDFVRLAREAVVERQRRAVRARMADEGKAVAEGQNEEDKAVDAKWWKDLLVATAWFPMAVNYGTETGFPGWNLGMMGLCGLVGTYGRTQQLWAATK
ncbi:hypothetical protein K432DRAFT_423727 [Lepidopterella palustris CBS 459.81]|uniref:Peroxin 11C n=1 Tax=Lepidopterella palustris CBS 459.81 TaxID=1314670 RepID=A0A8E2EFP9_9PEZI|nr:hypothetical protein K432DRAFT_423727 [Lepidopterella palustris CBS 459.81]